MSRQRDAYVGLALCIGVVSVVGSIWLAAEFFGDFPPTNSAAFAAWARSLFGQASIVLAMICAILLGRQAFEHPEVADLGDEPDQAPRSDL